jgi:hypothetical protein
MIYEIEGQLLCEVVTAGATMICNSSDGFASLVQSDVPINNAINIFEDTSLNNLLHDPKWRQPCADC